MEQPAARVLLRASPRLEGGLPGRVAAREEEGTEHISAMDRKVEPPSRWRRRLVWAVAAVLLVGMAAAAYWKFALTRTLVVS
jgi:hypothetical protein